MPSSADISATSTVSSAAQILGIKLLDHVIVTDFDSYSFQDDGRLR